MLLAGGTADLSFGTAGEARTLINGGPAVLTDFATQSDGKIVAVGYVTRSSNNDIVVVRYTADGQIDPTFAQGGLQPGVANIAFGPNSDDRAFAVAIQSDDKIVVAGSTSNGTNSDMLVARLSASGSLDANFNNSGIATIDFRPSDVANDVAIQTDGNIVVVGAAGSDFGLARLTPSGARDSTFGTAGIQLTDLGLTDAANAVALSGSKIVVGGESSGNFALARYNMSNGVLDGSFTNGGFTVFSPAGRQQNKINDLAIQSDGRIVAAGESLGGSRFFLTNDFAVLRFTSDGRNDLTFGQGGQVFTDFGGNDTASAVAIQPDNKILVAGTSFPGVIFKTVRYFSDGSMDTGYGLGGSTTFPFGTANAIALQGNDKILVGGFSPQGEFVIDRYTLGNPQGEFEFGATVYQGQEGSTPVMVTINRAGGSLGTTSVQVDATDISATFPGDYTPNTAVVTFNPGETSKTIAFSLPLDQSPEGTETFRIDLSSPTGGAILGASTRQSATVRITDSPGVLQFATLQFTATTLTDKVATITVTRTVGIGGPISVHYATGNGGTAQPNVDFTPTSGTLSFGDTETIKTFTIPLITNLDATGTKTIPLTLSMPMGGATLGTPATAQLVLQAPSSLEFGGSTGAPLGTFFRAESNVKGALTTATITVLRTGGLEGTTQVDYATADGTATARINYVMTSGTLVFGPGETSKSFPVQVIGDGVAKGNTSVRILLSNPAGGGTLGGRSEATLVIVDAPGRFQFSTSNYQYQESAGSALITIQRLVGIGGVVSVDFTTFDIDGKAGVDYAGTKGRVTFAPGEVSKSIRVPIINDGKLLGNNRAFGIQLSNPTGGSELGTVDRTTVTILDSRQPGAVNDFNGDGKSAVAVYRPDTQQWFAADAPSIPFGGSGDFPLPGNYNIPAKTDFAVYRPSTAQWFINGKNNNVPIQFGAPYLDVPVPADYDGDGKTDIAVFRPTTAVWYILGSSTGLRVVAYGAPGVDRPIPADYDGDGLADIAVFRPLTSQWFIAGTSGVQKAVSFGAPALDQPIQADYDGDGKADIAVFRPTTDEWFILRSSNNTTLPIQFGAVGTDIPVPGDYDGDKKSDLAVYRVTTGEWFLRYADGRVQKVLYGQGLRDLPTDMPLSFRERAVRPPQPDTPQPQPNGGFGTVVGSTSTYVPLVPQGAAHDQAIELFADALLKGKPRSTAINFLR